MKPIQSNLKIASPDLLFQKWKMLQMNGKQTKWINGCRFESYGDGMDMDYMDIIIII